MTDKREASPDKQPGSSPGDAKLTLPASGLAEEILANIPPDVGADKDVSTGDDTEQISARELFYGGRRQRSVDDDDPIRAYWDDDDDDLEDRMAQLVTFFLGRQEYGLPIRQVQEINRVGEITRVPNAHEHVVGVINLRGRIVPVLELTRRLGLGTAEITKASRIVVVESGSKINGLLVDRVAQVLQLATDVIETTPDDVVRGREDLTAGVAKTEERMIVILDLNKILVKT